MPKHLVVVESPAKAKTLKKILGNDYIVESSIGHIRDLPSKADEIPEAHRKKPWARTGVNVEEGFKPLYIVPADKKQQVKKLKDLLADADSLYLATDEDREGEAIAWHLLEVLKPGKNVPVRRMVFHEITESAVKAALTNTRELDYRLVSAQETRRILDRLFGYEVSPVLWKKVRPGLSAGRVQSVATRLIVERERLRMRFHSGTYWTIHADLAKLEKATGPTNVKADLVELCGQRIATGKDFDAATGMLTKEAQGKVLLLNATAAETLRAALEPLPFTVDSVTRKPFTQRPAAPFITSSLQQEAARKLSFATNRTMRVAQRLYENGYITYMRTDSTTLSEQAILAARKQIASLYGADYLPDAPKVYAGKVKGAQEAHEAIRPAGESFRTPEQLRSELDDEAFKLYDLIWKRTIACQMKDAVGERTQVRFRAELSPADYKAANIDAQKGGPAFLQAGGKVIHFPGFLRAYVEGTDDPDAELADQEVVLPPLKENERLDARAVTAAGHETQPPARFTEASLVAELERLGIGRPSTYASIIQTIQDRGYVWKRKGTLVPTLTAFAVTNLLESAFDELVDYAFTARMESDLDAISDGALEAEPWLRAFYFGEGSGPRSAQQSFTGESRLRELGLDKMISNSVEDIDARGVSSIELGKTPSGETVAARVGRYGPYVQVGDSEQRATIPEETPPDELTVDRALEMIRGAKTGNRELGNDPTSGEPVLLKTGRFGPYVQLGLGEDRTVKPKMASLWPTMQPESLTLDEALTLLSFPRTLGKHPETGLEVKVDAGQYGPYVFMEKGGTRESRSLENHAQLTTITLAEAVHVLAQPRTNLRSKSTTAQGPIATLAVSPVTGKNIEVRNGRFGPYVTDGQVNATIRASRDPATITMDDALELIAQAEQRARDQGRDPRAPQPAKGGARRSSGARAAKASPAKKAPAKKAAAKKAPAAKASTDAAPAKKAAAKKTILRKSATK